jgi:hypothetical protein
VAFFEDDEELVARSDRLIDDPDDEKEFRLNLRRGSSSSSLRMKSELSDRWRMESRHDSVSS